MPAAGTAAALFARDCPSRNRWRQPLRYTTMAVLAPAPPSGRAEVLVKAWTSAEYLRYGVVMLGRAEHAKPMAQHASPVALLTD